MEKKIVLSMRPNKDIVITMNNVEKLTIESSNRNIDASAIYKLLDYSKNDTYTVESLNEPNIDKPVLSFFSNLIIDIADKLRSM